MRVYFDNNDNMKRITVSGPTDKGTCVIKARGYGTTIALSLSKLDVEDIVNSLIRDFDLKIKGVSDE